MFDVSCTRFYCCLFCTLAFTHSLINMSFSSSLLLSWHSFVLSLLYTRSHSPASNSHSLSQVLHATVRSLINATCDAVDNAAGSFVSVPIRVGTSGSVITTPPTRRLRHARGVGDDDDGSAGADASCSVHPPCDVDQNCALNLMDVCLTNAHVRGETIATATATADDAGSTLTRMDANADGAVTVDDVIHMTRMVFRQSRCVFFLLAIFPSIHKPAYTLSTLVIVQASW